MTQNTQNNLPQFIKASEVMSGALASLKSEPPKVVVTAERLNKMALQVEVIDSESYEMAAEDLGDIMANKKSVEAMRVEAKAPFLTGGKQVDAFFKAPLDYLKSAESTLKKALQDFNEKQSEEAEKQHRIAEAAKEKAIDKAKESGDTAMAEALENAVTPSVSLAAKAKPAGLSERNTWKAKVESLSELMLAILDPENELATVDLITVNQSKLDKMAKAMKDNQVLKGVKFYSTKSIVAKATK